MPYRQYNGPVKCAKTGKSRVGAKKNAWKNWPTSIFRKKLNECFGHILTKLKYWL